MNCYNGLIGGVTKMKKYLFVFFMIVTLLFMAGCAIQKQEEAESEGVAETEETSAAEPQFQELTVEPDTGMGPYSKACICEDGIYYMGQKEEEVAVYYRPSGSGEAKVYLPWNTENGEIRAMSMSADGILSLIAAGQEEGTNQERLSWLKYNRWGDQVQALSISGLPENAWILFMAQTPEGRTFVRVSQGGSGGDRLMELDGEGTLRDIQARMPRSLNGIGSTGNKGQILLFNMDGLYAYDGREECREVLKWSDVFVSGEQVRAVWQSEEDVWALLVDDIEGTAELALVRAGSEESRRKKLVLATLHASSELSGAVSQFNRSQTEYQIQIVEYLGRDYSGDDRKEVQTAISRMAADLLGDKAPDMLDLSLVLAWGDATTLTVPGLLEKGYLLDLTPFAEKSETIHLSDYQKKLLEICSHEGKVAAIPAAFELATLVADSEIIGDGKGWKVSDFVNLGKNLKMDELLPGMDRWKVLEFCIEPNLSFLVDEEKGICHFDREEFREVMEWAAALPENENDYSKLYKEKGVVRFREIQKLDYFPKSRFDDYGDRANYIGFPTFDGLPGYKMIPALNSGLLSICSTCMEPEGAWRFIEYYLGITYFRENEGFLKFTDRSRYYYGMPANKKVFREYLAYLMKDGGGLGEIPTEEVREYYEKNSPDQYHYQPMTRQEADTVEYMVEHARPQTASEKLYMAIITEEVAPYFAGQKSLDEVIEIMQNRIELFLAENNG